MRGHRCHHENPSRLNPITGAKDNAERRATILQEMYNQDYITKEEQEEALADDVYSRIQNVDLANKENDTPYSYYTDELIEQVTEALKEELGYTDTQASTCCSGGGLRHLHAPGSEDAGHCGRGDQQSRQLRAGSVFH